MTGWVRHAGYEAVERAALESHAHGRRFDGITDELVLLARLYSYGFRGHVIGAFHAAAQALEKFGDASKEAVRTLRELASMSLEPVPNDFRAVLTTFYRYDRAILHATVLLHALALHRKDEESARIEQRFLAAINRVSSSSGIAVTRDDEIPEQASFIVPSLGITIVPLVYGDQHSWNMAFLSGTNLDVPRHRHHEGAEIHLGLGSLQGETCLGGFRAAVNEGYAMPIPAGTPHGYLNHAGHDHRLPFIFGSKRLGGWGIFPDVEPQPAAPDSLKSVPRDGGELNGTAWLDREIDAIARETGTKRRTLLAAERTFTPQAGGLALSIARIDTDPYIYSENAGRFVTVGVMRGRGRVKIGPAEADLEPHAHFGIPAGARATITATEPLVLLDAQLVETISS